MSELDEVSLHIGQLTGQVESLNSNMERLITWIKDGNADMKITLSNQKKEFDELAQKVQRLEGFRNRVYAMASVCSLAVGGALHLAMEYFTGKHNGG